MAKVRISIPESAQKGEIIEIKTLISHPMESGFRIGVFGETIPRNILTDFKCLYNGDEVFRAEFFPAVTANPFLTFHTVAQESGELTFIWTDQHGEVTSETRNLTVT